jgi:hypothetical protein
MAAAAMPLEELERWLQAGVDRRPVATDVPMLDGYVTAIVAGPASISPLEWICPLLAVDADAFNHGDTSISRRSRAVARRHNDISRVLTTTPVQGQCIGATPTATSIRVPGAGIPPPCGSAVGFGAAARHRDVDQRLLCPSVALSRRPGAPTARATSSGP